MSKPTECIVLGTFKDARFDPPKKRVEGDRVEIKDPERLERWQRRELVEPLHGGPDVQYPWGQHYGRGLRAVPRKKVEWKNVVACLNVWNGMPILKETLPTWYDHVDRVIAVDGAYRGVPTVPPHSTDGTIEFLESLDKVELVEADGYWENQCVKRTEYFNRAENGELLFVVDDDEYVSGAKHLRSTPWCDVGWVEYSNPLYERSQGFPRVFRAQDGLRYYGRHHWIYKGEDLVTTCQRGGPGFDHARVPVRVRNTRGNGRPKVRKSAARVHRAIQANKESEAGPEQVGGREPLRIFQSTSIDPGMVVYRLHSAINCTTPHESIMSRARHGRPYQEPTQYRAQSDRPAVREAAKSADVLHCHLDYHSLKSLGVRTEGVVVAHHHGTMLREQPTRRAKNDKREGAVLRLVSNLELLSYGDDLVYLPNPVPAKRYKRLRNNYPKAEDGTFRVAHSPSKRKLKGTEDFLEACERLQGKGLEVEPVLIENKPHAESIKMKASCDAAFDSFWLGMQCSGLEAAAMGMPVIAGDSTVADRYRDAIGHVPYTFADNVTQLEWALEAMITDIELYEEEAERVETYTRAWHDYPVVAKRYLDLLDLKTSWRNKMTFGNEGRLTA